MWLVQDAVPPSSELSKNQSVKARFWPWLEPFSVRKSEVVAFSTKVVICSVRMSEVVFPPRQVHKGIFPKGEIKAPVLIRASTLWFG